MFFLSRKFTFFLIFLILVVIFNIFFLLNVFDTEELKQTDSKSLVNEKVSWEDLDWINYEKNRSGPGEQGQEYVETDPELIAKNEEWLEKEGFYVEVSNKISLTRALPDHRLPV